MLPIRLLRFAISALLLSVILLGGCSVQQRIERSQSKIEKGKVTEGFSELKALAQENHRDPVARADILHEQEQQLHKLLTKADELMAEKKLDEAEQAYIQIIIVDPYNKRAQYALVDIQRARRHANWLRQADNALSNGDAMLSEQLSRRILSENPRQQEALALIERLESLRQDQQTDSEQVLNGDKLVDLEFKNAAISMVLEALSKSSSLNFVLDRDVKPDLRTTLLAHQIPLSDALEMLLKTNQLEKKAVKSGTYIIYPNNPAKQKEYQELMIKTFYLGNAEAKTTASLIKTLVKTNDLHVDERLNLIVMRDTPEAIEAAAKIILSQDLAEPEVELQIEVMEITRDKLTQLGIQPPDQISGSLVSTAGIVGTLPAEEALNLTKSNVQISTPSPTAVLNLKHTTGATHTLANPRIRIMNREKAKVHIGDKVPVITTNTNQTTGTTISESVSYLDVGLKIEAEPQVFLDNEIAIKLNLEVNNIVKEVTSKTGLLTYQVGTRMANTTLRLNDGETQVIAGLIKTEDSSNMAGLPWLSDIPLLGRFFSSHKDSKSESEIVLLLTPRIIRSLQIPAAYNTQFISGTGSNISVPSLRLPPKNDSSQRSAIPQRLGNAEMPPAQSLQTGSTDQPIPPASPAARVDP